MKYSILNKQIFDNGGIRTNVLFVFDGTSYIEDVNHGIGTLLSDIDANIKQYAQMIVSREANKVLGKSVYDLIELNREISF